MIYNQAGSVEVQEGEILVAPMTSPSYRLVLSKVAAIVTDEGGSTCMAALDAQHLRKPCIIGTKIATKFLKNGDLVEVDKVKGIVKKV